LSQSKVRKSNGTYPAPTTKVVPMKLTLPHYTNRSVVALFRNNDPRITTDEYGYGPQKSIVLSNTPGYFMFSDKDGGTATFYAETHEPEYKVTPTFTASIEITDQMRESKCTDPSCGCDSPWTNITHSCGCKTHHEGETFGVLPRVEVCSPDECDGKHGHLLGFCDACADIEEMGGKAVKDITADQIHLRLR